MALLAVLLSCFALLARIEKVVGQTSYTCDDAYECDGLTLSSTYLLCYGYFSCDDADITATYLYSYGAYSNYLSTATTSYAYMYGFQAGYGMSLATQYVYAYGFYGLYLAEIEPQTDTLYAYLYGYYAGIYAEVSCYSGDACSIYCGSANGCYGLDFYCYSGATCYFNCDDTGCPNLIGSESALVTFDAASASSVNQVLYKTDSEINAKREEKQETKARMSESGELDAQLAEHISKTYKGREDELPAEVLESLQLSLSMPHASASKKDEYLSGLALGGLVGVVSGLVLAGVAYKINECRKLKSNDYKYQQLA